MSNCFFSCRTYLSYFLGSAKTMNPNESITPLPRKELSGKREVTTGEANFSSSVHLQNTVPLKSTFEILVITPIIWSTRYPAFLPVLLQLLSYVAIFPSSNHSLMQYWIWHFLNLFPRVLAGAFASSAASQKEETAAFLESSVRESLHIPIMELIGCFCDTRKFF